VIKRMLAMTAAASLLTPTLGNAQERGVGNTESPAEEYSRLLTEIGQLDRYNASLAGQIEDQESFITQRRAEIAGVDVLKDAIRAMMPEMLSVYEQIVDDDLPFDLINRRARIDRYANALNSEKADENIAQNFRLLLEAFQIELDAGRAVAWESEPFRDESDEVVLDENGDPEMTEYLRVGRIAYMRVNRKRGILQAWDRDAEGWADLPDSYRQDLDFGLRIAKEQTAPEVFFVPVKPPAR